MRNSPEAEQQRCSEQENHQRPAGRRVMDKSRLCALVFFCSEWQFERSVNNFCGLFLEICLRNKKIHLYYILDYRKEKEGRAWDIQE